ncbi:MAG TPA: DUF1501 domain-containing protein [Leptospiraceae bacterium]|nr:DUF1501 domain-containing protein [Leptospiraceae bacterium]HRG75143.1 DUF1501 domain-containing protein [Leptospiraceae bacterium]
MISRKQFLKYAALATAGLSLSDKLRITAELEAASLSATGKTLIHVLLEGGPDFLHLIVPKPSSDTTSYGYKYWNNRTKTVSRGTEVANPNSWVNAYSKDYQEFTLDGQTFGVLKGDSGSNIGYNGWLISQIQAGKVAIICNVKHSSSRDHSNSLMVAQTGLYASNPLQTSVQGWGGQLINALSQASTPRLLSMTYGLRQFCSTSSSATNKAVSFSDSRKFGLTRTADLGTESNTDLRFKRARAMQTYLQARNADTTWNTNNPLFKKFTSQHSKLLGLTDSVKTILSTSNPQSTDIANLYAKTGNTGLVLKDTGFGRQIANLYDALQVPALNMRIASLAYGGWDSHKNQKTDIEPQFDDLFGTGKAFDTLFKQTGGASVLANSVLMFYGEFGRQLKANGDGGTDHGRGNFIILVGGKVNGGIYGTLFPDKDKDNFDKANRDIDTTKTDEFTSFDPIYNRIASWMNGSANSITLTLSGETTFIDKSGVKNLNNAALLSDV